MEHMNNFLRRKTYRTCAVLISGAAMVMAATVVNKNMDNNIADNETVNGQALLHHTDLGESDEDVAPGYLPLDRVYLGTVEKIQADKLQIEAAVIPMVAMPKDEGTVESGTEASTEKTVKNEAEEVSNEEVIVQETASVEILPEENETEKSENIQVEETTTSNEETGDVTASIGNAVRVSNEEYEALQRIVEAEAGNQDDIGRILVANVVLNRVKSDKYPDSILENIFRHSGNIYQFEPVQNGTYYSVTVSEKTKECVDRALAGEDYSQGALYFTRQTSENSWFNTSLTLLFVHGVHYFYK